MSSIKINLNSRILMTPVEVKVLMPDFIPGTDTVSLRDFYQSGKKYKVLWLLHGAEEDCNTWFDYTNVAQYAMGHDIVIVSPTALNSDYANHPEFAGGYNYTDFFFEELMPMIYGWLPVSSRPEDNFISGLSMGGSGALLLGLYKPELFGGIAPVSSSLRESEFLKPYGKLSGEQFRQKANEDPLQFPTEYGDPRHGITRKEINMIAKYPTVQDYIDSYECMWERFPEVVRKGTLPPMYFLFGTKESCYEKLLIFKKYAEELGATGITYDIHEGYGHDFSLWDICIKKVLNWIDELSSN